MATSSTGHGVLIRPFPGMIGISPAVADGQVYCSGWVLGVSGGNMDCRELVAGSRLLLPVMVDGGWWMVAGR